MFYMTEQVRIKETQEEAIREPKGRRERRLREEIEKEHKPGWRRKYLTFGH